MAKKTQNQQAAQPTTPSETDEAKAAAAEPELETEDAEAGPPQGLTVRYLNTGTRNDFHRHHFGRQGLPDVRRIDPASLRTPEGYDPWLRFSNGAVMQVRADHAAELLECDDLTGGESRHRLATEAEIEAEKARMQDSLRR